jgi:hypothetical protein
MVDLFSRIKKLRDKLNFDVLDDELSKWKLDSQYINYHINLKKYDDIGLFLLYPDNVSPSLRHNDNLIDSIVRNCELMVFELDSLRPITTFYNKTYFDDKALDIINDTNWDNIEITKYCLESKHICIFNNNKNWYYVIRGDNTLTKLESGGDIYGNFCLNLNELNSDHVYHFLLKHKNFRKIGYCGDNYENSLSLLWVCDKNLNLVSYTENITLAPREKVYYFSCLDELTTSLEIMSNNTIVSKSLIFGGYFIKILSPDKTRYILCALMSDIYKYILSVLPKYSNQYVNYLQLYQHNNLGEVLQYLHKYPTDVIRRINMSIKTLSKEILNIYHLTRKKQNSNLYDCLAQSYKKVLYDLHKIYVNQKYEGFIIKSDEILIEKKSISVDIVYNYLKSLSCENLLQIFIDRSPLIEKLNEINYEHEEILYVDNIDIVTQIELMST